MVISFNFPSDYENELRESLGDLGQAAKVGFLIESYRRSSLSVGDIARILNFETRYQAEQWLGERGIVWNYDQCDLRDDLDGLGKHGQTEA